MTDLSNGGIKTSQAMKTEHAAGSSKLTLRAFTIENQNSKVLIPDKCTRIMTCIAQIVAANITAP